MGKKNKLVYPERNEGSVYVGLNLFTVMSTALNCLLLLRSKYFLHER